MKKVEKIIALALSILMLASALVPYQIVAKNKDNDIEGALAILSDLSVDDDLNLDSLDNDIKSTLNSLNKENKNSKLDLEEKEAKIINTKGLDASTSGMGYPGTWPQGISVGWTASGTVKTKSSKKIGRVSFDLKNASTGNNDVHITSGGGLNVTSYNLNKLKASASQMAKLKTGKYYYNVWVSEQGKANSATKVYSQTFDVINPNAYMKTVYSSPTVLTIGQDFNVTGNIGSPYHMKNIRVGIVAANNTGVWLPGHKYEYIQPDNKRFGFALGGDSVLNGVSDAMHFETLPEGEYVIRCWVQNYYKDVNVFNSPVFKVISGEAGSKGNFSYSNMSYPASFEYSRKITRPFSPYGTITNNSKELTDVRAMIVDQWGKERRCRDANNIKSNSFNLNNSDYMDTYGLGCGVHYYRIIAKAKGDKAYTTIYEKAFTISGTNGCTFTEGKMIEDFEYGYSKGYTPQGVAHYNTSSSKINMILAQIRDLGDTKTYFTLSKTNINSYDYDLSNLGTFKAEELNTLPPGRYMYKVIASPTDINSPYILKYICTDFEVKGEEATATYTNTETPQDSLTLNLKAGNYIHDFRYDASKKQTFSPIGQITADDNKTIGAIRVSIVNTTDNEPRKELTAEVKDAKYDMKNIANSIDLSDLAVGEYKYVIEGKNNKTSGPFFTLYERAFTVSPPIDGQRIANCKSFPNLIRIDINDKDHKQPEPFKPEGTIIFPDGINISKVTIKVVDGNPKNDVAGNVDDNTYFCKDEYSGIYESTFDLSKMKGFTKENMQAFSSSHEREKYFYQIWAEDTSGKYNVKLYENSFKVTDEVITKGNFTLTDHESAAKQYLLEHGLVHSSLPQKAIKFKPQGEITCNGGLISNVRVSIKDADGEIRYVAEWKKLSRNQFNIAKEYTGDGFNVSVLGVGAYTYCIEVKEKLTGAKYETLFEHKFNVESDQNNGVINENKDNGFEYYVPITSFIKGQATDFQPRGLVTIYTGTGFKWKYVRVAIINKEDNTTELYYKETKDIDDNVFRLGTMDIITAAELNALGIGSYLYRVTACDTNGDKIILKESIFHVQGANGEENMPVTVDSPTNPPTFTYANNTSRKFTPAGTISTKDEVEIDTIHIYVDEYDEGVSGEVKKVTKKRNIRDDSFNLRNLNYTMELGDLPVGTYKYHILANTVEDDEFYELHSSVFNVNTNGPIVEGFKKMQDFKCQEASAFVSGGTVSNITNSANLSKIVLGIYDETGSNLIDSTTVSSINSKYYSLTQTGFTSTQLNKLGMGTYLYRLTVYTTNGSVTKLKEHTFKVQMGSKGQTTGYVPSSTPVQNNPSNSGGGNSSTIQSLVAKESGIGVPGSKKKLYVGDAFSMTGKVYFENNKVYKIQRVEIGIVKYNSKTKQYDTWYTKIQRDVPSLSTIDIAKTKVDGKKTLDDLLKFGSVKDAGTYEYRCYLWANKNDKKTAKRAFNKRFTISKKDSSSGGVSGGGSNGAPGKITTYNGKDSRQSLALVNHLNNDYISKKKNVYYTYKQAFGKTEKNNWCTLMMYRVAGKTYVRGKKISYMLGTTNTGILNWANSIANLAYKKKKYTVSDKKRTSTPTVGNIVVFSGKKEASYKYLRYSHDDVKKNPNLKTYGDHIGIVASVNTKDKTFTTIEGNTGSKDTKKSVIKKKTYWYNKGGVFYDTGCWYSCIFVNWD